MRRIALAATCITLIATGTHKGPLGEIPASGNFVKVANNCFFRFAVGEPARAHSFKHHDWQL